MEDPLKPVWADIGSLPIRNLDEVDPTSDEEASQAGTLAIVPAPRPFAYREPIGTSEPEEALYPRRRRTDQDPQK